MYISAKTGYAIRALVELSKQPENTPLPLAEICTSQNIPFKYTEQLFRKLKKHNLIKSVYGSQGGYVLAKEPDNISLKDIMHAIGEEVCNTYCEPDKKEYCKGLPCGIHDMWNEIQEHFISYFSKIKLSNIAQKIKRG